MTMKVRLEEPRLRGFDSGYMSRARIKSSLPFVEAGKGEYTHRVRSATIYTVLNGNCFTPTGTTHIAAVCWCGQTILLSRKRKSQFVVEPSEGRPVCATCEGRATGAGQLGAAEIAGRAVKYAPRKSA